MGTCTHAQIFNNKSKQINSRPRTYTGNFKTLNKETKKHTKKIWEKLKK